MRSWSVCCFFLLVLVLGIGRVGAEDWWRVYGTVGEGLFFGGQRGGEGLGDGDGAFFERTEFDEWVAYEDEFVRLWYPKHPGLKLEINEGEGGIRVEGGVCTTVDHSFSRAYVLTAGAATYGVFLLNPAEWLDDGI